MSDILASLNNVAFPAAEETEILTNDTIAAEAERKRIRSEEEEKAFLEHMNSVLLEVRDLIDSAAKRGETNAVILRSRRFDYQSSPGGSFIRKQNILDKYLRGKGYKTALLEVRDDPTKFESIKRIEMRAYWGQIR